MTGNKTQEKIETQINERLRMCARDIIDAMGQNKAGAMFEGSILDCINRLGVLLADARDLRQVA